LESISSMLTNGQTEGLTDISKLLVAFHNFAYKPKNCREI